MIYERAKSLSANAEVRDYAQMFTQPYVDCGATAYARFFDAIDLIDLCEGERGSL